MILGCEFWKVWVRYGIGKAKNDIGVGMEDWFMKWIGLSCEGERMFLG